LLRPCAELLRLFAELLRLDPEDLALDFEPPWLRLAPERWLALRVPEPRPRLLPELLPPLDLLLDVEPLPLALDLDDLADDLPDDWFPFEAFVDADEPLDEPDDLLRVEARFEDPR
jgi:hypothetical protein